MGSLSNRKYPKRGIYLIHLSIYLSIYPFIHLFIYLSDRIILLYSPRRSNIFFSFSMISPGLFGVAVLYKIRHISEMKLQLDDLLERQHNNNLELETEFLKLNVNLLIFLLNKLFMSQKYYTSTSPPSSLLFSSPPSVVLLLQHQQYHKNATTTTT